MVQAVACRAAIYGFNSHPQLHGCIHILFGFPEDFATIIIFSSDEREAILDEFVCFSRIGCHFADELVIFLERQQLSID